MSVLQKNRTPPEKRDRHRQFGMQTNQWRAEGAFPGSAGGFVKGRSVQFVQTELGLHSLMPQFTFYIT